MGSSRATSSPDIERRQPFVGQPSPACRRGGDINGLAQEVVGRSRQSSLAAWKQSRALDFAGNGDTNHCRPNARALQGGKRKVAVPPNEEAARPHAGSGRVLQPADGSVSAVEVVVEAARRVRLAPVIACRHRERGGDHAEHRSDDRRTIVPSIVVRGCQPGQQRWYGPARGSPPCRCHYSR
jgi:hypothetical protein